MDRIGLGVIALLAVVLMVTSGADIPTQTPSGAQSELRPPGGRWQTDADGRQYYVSRIAKTQAQRRPDGSVVTTYGVRLVVVREDARYFYYKIFRTSGVGAEPTAGTRTDSATADRVTTRTSSRWHFASFGSGLPRSGQWRNAFSVYDMNGDGHPDVVSPAPRKTLRPPVVFLSDGRGHFRLWDVRFPSGSYDYGAAAAGDLNGDGHGDIALGLHLLGVEVLLGDGRGGFTTETRGLDPPRPDGSPADFSSQALDVVDWDKDSREDVVALGEGPRLATSSATSDTARGVVVYRNLGAAGFSRTAPQTRIFGESIATGDVDGDGRTDAVASSRAFGRADLLFLGTDDGGRTSELPALRPNSYVLSVAVGDVDGDGRSDIVTGYLSFNDSTWHTGIDVLLRRANGWRRKPLFVEKGTTGVYSLATGDVDGDHAIDVVGVTGNGDTLVFPGDGHGFLTRERHPVPRFRGSCRGSHVELRDLDGDHREEILASFAEEPGASHCPSGGGVAVWRVRRP